MDTLTSPTIDVSFLREFDHDYSPELGQLMLPCGVTAPMFSNEFPPAEPEPPVRTDVDKKRINLLKHKNHQELSLRIMR